ncbi:hypothetical protein ACFQ0T_37610 [Kitasatospora gansuensis]
MSRHHATGLRLRDHLADDGRQCTMNSEPASEGMVEQKAAALLSAVREAGPFAVAYSGGADSALVLAAGAGRWARAAYSP